MTYFLNYVWGYKSSTIWGVTKFYLSEEDICLSGNMNVKYWNEYYFIFIIFPETLLSITVSNCAA